MKMFIDPNFPLIYNMTLLEEAGVSEPPSTVDELDRLVPKLSRRGSDGQLEQIAMEPWNLGAGHWFQTWGLTFGAQIWEGDEYSGRFTLVTDPWIRALSWMHGYYERYAPDMGGWGNLPWWRKTEWLSTGKIVMSYHVSPTLKVLKDSSPYQWGIAPPITAPRGAAAPLWFGGFTFGIGKFAKNIDVAYDFLEFITWNREGSRIIGEAGLFAAYQGAEGLRILIEQSPEWQALVEAISLSPGNLYVPPQVNFGAAADAFKSQIQQDGVPIHSALEEMERLLNAEASEKGIFAERR